MIVVRCSWSRSISVLLISSSVSLVLCTVFTLARHDVLSGVFFLCGESGGVISINLGYKGGTPLKFLMKRGRGVVIIINSKLLLSS